MQIHQINYATTIIKTYRDEKMLKHATGFFFNGNERKYLITNRHVVIDEQDNYHPNIIEIRLHSANSDGLTDNIQIKAKIKEDENPLWHEHPNYIENMCDVVAIPLNITTLVGLDYQNFISAKVNFFNRSSITEPLLNPFGDLVAVGYPLNFYDKYNNLPIYRKAMIASQYSVNFEHEPFFLVDAVLHEGMSGSPVVNSFHTLFKERVDTNDESYELFGVFSDEKEINGKPLGLNAVWYARLILEIIAGK